MEWWKTDLVFLEEALPEMERYILSEQIFWQMTSGSRLSLGMLLFKQKRLSVVDDLSPVRETISEINYSFTAFRTQWRTNWSLKAGKEYGARLRQWDQSMSELLIDRDQAITPAYRHEITWRVILSLLEDELLQPASEQVHFLTGLDARLKASTRKGTFIWEEELTPVFPEDRFWYLYVSGFWRRN